MFTQKFNSTLSMGACRAHLEGSFVWLRLLAQVLRSRSRKHTEVAIIACSGRACYFARMKGMMHRRSSYIQPHPSLQTLSKCYWPAPICYRKGSDGFRLGSVPAFLGPVSYCQLDSLPNSHFMAFAVKAGQSNLPPHSYQSAAH